MSNKILTVLRCAVLFVCLILYVLSYVIYGKTMICFWTPVIVALLVAAVSASFMAGRWRWLTTSENKILNILCHLFVVGCVVYSVFLLGNYYLADASSEHTEEVYVEKKTKVKRRKTRRVGRNRYVSDGYRYEYYIYVRRNDNNSLKEISVSLNVYNKLRTGAIADLEMQKGFFGYPVVTHVDRHK